jgi:hypothetical protein
MIPTEGDNKPPLKAVNLQNVFRLRDRLRDQAGFGHEGRRIEGDAFRAFTDDLWAMLKPLKIDRATVVDSCRYLLGSILDPDDLAVLSWRMAGNVARLKSGRAAVPWTFQDGPEWVPLQVVSCRPARDYKHRRGASVAIRPLAGTSCPNVFEQFWTGEQCSLFAATAMGFDSRRGAGYDRDPRSLTRLRFYGLFTPDSCRNGKPRASEFRGTSSTFAYNRPLIDVRVRLALCPRGYDHPCGACPVGYSGPDSCPYSVHPEPWEYDTCDHCGEEERPFDLSLSRSACVICALADA